MLLPLVLSLVLLSLVRCRENGICMNIKEVVVG